jgi:hypothetical protein
LDEDKVELKKAIKASQLKDKERERRAHQPDRKKKEDYLA